MSVIVSHRVGLARDATVARVCHLVVPLASAWVLASCGPAVRSRPVTGTLALSPVRVPPGGEIDQTSSLVDGQVSNEGWYCTHARAPQRFEFLIEDDERRPVVAVGWVVGNVGNGGLGPMEIRVQQGHGPSAAGESFRVVARSRNDTLTLVRFPTPVRGDHIVITLTRRSPWNTATCFGEVVALDRFPPPHSNEAFDTLTAERVEAPSTPTANGSNVPLAHASSTAAVQRSGDAGLEAHTGATDGSTDAGSTNPAPGAGLRAP